MPNRKVRNTLLVIVGGILSLSPMINLLTPRAVNKFKAVDTSTNIIAQISEPITSQYTFITNECDLNAPDHIWGAIASTKASCKHQRWLVQMSWSETKHKCNDSKISSAKGCVQFLDSSWRDMCKKYGFVDVRNAEENFGCAALWLQKDERNLYYHWLKWWPKAKAAAFVY